MKKIILLASATIGLAITSCNSSKKEEESHFNFLVTSVLKKDTATTKEYVCQIHGVRHIELRTLERGYLSGIYVNEGDHVTKGQLMFKILPSVYNAEKEIAKAEAAYANVEYQNTKRLADSDIVSKNQLLLSKAELQKAEANLNLAKTHLGFTEIRAPFDGIMDRYHARLGSLMDEGDLLSSLSDISKMWVYFNVSERSYLNLFRAVAKDSTIKVKLRLANLEIYKYPGIVNTIEADFNNETGNIALRATFPNPNRLLRHGETGSILVTSPIKGALLIPQKATWQVLEKRYVFVVDKNNVVHQREIVIGQELSDLYVIKSGLKEGDKILVTGIRKAEKNEKIKFQYVAPKKLFPQLQVEAQ